jgi:ribosomal protein L37AE/L43A
LFQGNKNQYRAYREIHRRKFHCPSCKKVAGVHRVAEELQASRQSLTCGDCGVVFAGTRSQAFCLRYHQKPPRCPSCQKKRHLITQELRWEKVRADRQLAEENKEPPSRLRYCPICGDSFRPLSSINLYCGKPECKRIRKKQLARAKYPKREL